MGNDGISGGPARITRWPVFSCGHGGVPSKGPPLSKAVSTQRRERLFRTRSLPGTAHAEPGLVHTPAAGRGSWRGLCCSRKRLEPDSENRVHVEFPWDARASGVAQGARRQPVLRSDLLSSGAGEGFLASTCWSPAARWSSTEQHLQPGGLPLSPGGRHPRLLRRLALPLLRTVGSSVSSSCFTVC